MPNCSLFALCTFFMPAPGLASLPLHIDLLALVEVTSQIAHTPKRPRMHANDVYPTNQIRVLKSESTYQNKLRENYFRATAPLI